MIAYIKAEGEDKWQKLGTIEGDINVEDPFNHYESAPAQEVTASISFEAKLTREARRKLFRPYPRLPRKLKKDIKSFRRWLGLSYKKCSRLELIQTCCMIWDMAPGHEGVINPAWLTKAGWTIAKGGES